MQKLLDDQHKDMKLQIQGLVPPGQQLYRNVLFDQLYALIPKDPEAKVQIYTAELAPKGWTNFHCHNGATFFLALQGVFEVHFEEGILLRAKAGYAYSEPIGKMHLRSRSGRCIAATTRTKRFPTSASPSASPRRIATT
jgi:quercetin dioxygenase-like cupin family protein